MKHGTIGKSLVAYCCYGMVAIALLSTGWLFPQTALAQGRGSAAPTRSELLATEIGILELVCGGPLTANERLQAAESVDIALSGNRAMTLKNFVPASNVLQKAAKDRDYAQSARQHIRFAVETTPPTPGLERADAIEAAIIRRHDPVVVLDRARHYLISENTLRDLNSNSAYYAQKLGLPAPSADFNNHLRAWIKANYQSSNANTVAILSEEPQNFMWLTDAFKSPRYKQAGIPTLRTKLTNESPAMRDVSLAIAVSTESRAIYAEVQRGMEDLKKTSSQTAGASAYGNLVQQSQGALWH